MNATISAGTTYYVENAAGDALVVGGTFTEDTEVEAINVLGKTYNVYMLNGKIIFVKASEDR